MMQTHFQCLQTLKEGVHNDSGPALNRKNALFAGHDIGAENWAIISSLIETCKLNAIDPLAYLSATLTAIVNDHRQSQVEVLLPWNYLAG
jgi:transposase